MSEKKARIAIVGTGAIGGYYGAMLARSGQDVHFLLRSDYDAVLREGLRVNFTKGDDFTLHPVQAYRDPTEMGEMDMVFIALKTTANNMLPALLKPLVGKDTWLITMQNGMGNADLLAREFGAERVLAAICFISLNRIAPGHIRNLYNGYLSVAEFQSPPSPRTAQLKAIFDQAGIQCDELQSLDETLWRKLCWNVPFNGLAIAAGGIATDRIVSSPPLCTLARSLMDELADAAAHFGHHIPETFLERQFTVTRKMGDYKPSSLIDFLQNRPVELEAIWGEPLRRGQAAGLPMARLEMLYHLLRHSLEYSQ